FRSEVWPRLPCGDSGQQDGLPTAGRDEPWLLASLLAGPFVPAICRDDDAAREKRAPERGALQNRVEPRVAGRPALVPGRLVAPEQPVGMRLTVAQAVQGDGAGAGWHIVLDALGHFKNGVRVRKHPFFIFAQASRLFDASAHGFHPSNGSDSRWNLNHCPIWRSYCATSFP